MQKATQKRKQTTVGVRRAKPVANIHQSPSLILKDLPSTCYSQTRPAQFNRLCAAACRTAIFPSNKQRANRFKSSTPGFGDLQSHHKRKIIKPNQKNSTSSQKTIQAHQSCRTINKKITKFCTNQLIALDNRSFCTDAQAKSDLIDVRQSLKGFPEWTNDEMVHFNTLVSTCRKYCLAHLFTEIKTPLLEKVALFRRAIGGDSDIVHKEMYEFKDKSGAHICLRPEATAGIMRLVLQEKSLLKRLPHKFFTVGSMFRHERPQKGRMRQFHQLDAEIIGDSSVNSDVELISLGHTILENLPVKQNCNFQLEINSIGDTESRAKYRVALENYLNSFSAYLSFNSLRNLQVGRAIRVLDSKSPEDMEITEKAPLLSEYLSVDSKNRFESLKEQLSHLGVPFTINNRLVRGLDYYTETVFEFSETEGALGRQQSAVLAGGRYDFLSQQIGHQSPIPSIGFASGLERLMLTLDTQSPLFQVRRPISVCAIPPSESSSHSGDPVTLAAMKIAFFLRKNGFPVLHSVEKSLTKQLSKSAKINSTLTIIVGENEIQEGNLTIKVMDEQRQVLCPLLDSSFLLNFCKQYSPEK